MDEHVGNVDNIMTSLVVGFDGSIGSYVVGDGTGLCEQCHDDQATNHYQSDGTAPGGQMHNEGQVCTDCHTHDGSFTDHLAGSLADAPHDTALFTGTGVAGAGCYVCHIDAQPFDTAITKDKCLGCHDGSGSIYTADHHNDVVGF